MAHQDRRNILRGLVSLPLVGGTALASRAAIASGPDAIAALKAVYLDAKAKHVAAEAFVETCWPAYVEVACSNRDGHSTDADHKERVEAFSRESEIGQAFETRDTIALEIDAEFYGRQATDMAVKARWLRLVADAMPATATAEKVLTDARLRELQEVARG